MANVIFVDMDPFAPHSEKCNFWHGGACNCHPDAIAAANSRHCHECDYVWAIMGAHCNCRGHCICEREEGCPCVEDGLEPPPTRLVS